MTLRLLKKFANSVNDAILPLGVKIVPSHDWDDPEQFIPFEQTVSASKKAGLPLGDYLDVTYNVAGATQATIDFMAELGVFAGTVSAVGEIGPGSGRYLEKVVRIAPVTHYEIYETARDWTEYLIKTYGVIACSSPGASMASTQNGSLDLVHAHKVFVATSFLTTCNYWIEMIRCARPGGHIVFDIMTEDCIGTDTLGRWLSLGIRHGGYPTIMPRDYTLEFFAARHVQFVGSKRISMNPGTSETMVFRKDAAAAAG